MKRDEVRRRLRESYDAAVETRDGRSAPGWERAQRDAFLELLQRERRSVLLYLALYGGRDFEGIWEGDSLSPKHF